MTAPSKTYDPHWPFPQYDPQGKRLLPANWHKKDPTHNAQQYPDNAQAAPY